VTEPASIEIRELGDYADFNRCVDFQRLIWGRAFSELVPAAILWVSARTGGVVLGAFEPSGEMVGFLFGITGFVDGSPYHWSDMLAVVPRVEGLGLGRSLKARQRDVLLRRGVNSVGWTFDPLESRNAHLNFARLGVTVREYVRDCYGRSDSPLHAGLPTDRFIADWRLDSERVRQRMDDGAAVPGPEVLDGVPLINPAVPDDEHELAARGRPDLCLDADRLALRIPASIQRLKQVDAEAAVRWRLVTRAALEAYLTSGYNVVELVRSTDQASCYVLARAPAGS
jgi:predicted GNAT superfamily acetyltransferase